MVIDVSNINIFLAIVSVFGIVFTVYFYFRNPQIKTDQVTLKLAEDILTLQKQVIEIKDTHIKSIEIQMKEFTTSMNELSKTVVKLATIIDERIPRAAASLTPPGQ